MNRRVFIQSLATSSIATLAHLPRLQAAVPKMKITRVRVYLPPNPNPLFNQSDMSSPSKPTPVSPGSAKVVRRRCSNSAPAASSARTRISSSASGRTCRAPSSIRRAAKRWMPWALSIWRSGTSRARFGTCPFTQILGGMVRDHCECYNTAGVIPGVQPGMSIKERAQATIAAGYRGFRMGAADTPAEHHLQHARARQSDCYEECAQAREGVGKNGDWCIDFHQRFDLSDAIRGCDLIKDLAPYFVEDPVRAEAFLEDMPILRRTVKVPIAAGEEWGNRWDFNKLVENHDIDYVRATSRTSAASPR